MLRPGRPEDAVRRARIRDCGQTRHVEEDSVPKLIPVPDALSKPFWDAVNERRLTVQQCTACNALQFPPRPRCRDCGSDQMKWKDTDGKGHILGFLTVEDGRIARMHPDQPYNIAVITLDEDPRINFYSNLPGTPPRRVTVGAAVEVTFEECPDGSLIHEWRVVS